MNNKSELLKTAAQKMLQLDRENKEHTKRAHALRLLYKQSEMGYEDLPRSYSELEEKLASLSKQDLNVMEKALEMTGGAIKLGELDVAVEKPLSKNAEEKFQATIIEG